MRDVAALFIAMRIDNGKYSKKSPKLLYGYHYSYKYMIRCPLYRRCLIIDGDDHFMLNLKNNSNEFEVDSR